MDAANQLDPLTFPLTGTRLIEASAGTGKTYTLAALYIRLILGHDLDSNMRNRDLFPPDILVVTFTEAATKELRERIRSQLSQAARYFNQQLDEVDENLTRLRASYLPVEWPACAHRLKLAADWMDEAAIYTIHGWCNRMLQEHAFDSGSLFRQEVNNDDLEMLNNVIRDYWRIFFYPLSGIQSYAVFKLASSPDKLTGLLKPLLSETVVVERETIDDSISDILMPWENWEQERRRLETDTRQTWSNDKEDLENLINSAIEKRWLNGNQYKQATIGHKLAAMAIWAQSGISLDLEAIEKFGQQKLVSGLVKAHQDKANIFQHPAMLAIDELVTHSSQETDIATQLRIHALHWVRNRYDNVKQRSARMTFDDMLVRLDKALQGANGQHLANIIRLQFKVALFDEFQDTDPVQYRIISSLYPANAELDLSCFMIGDPKQAIYSFRGADIFTYLKAYHSTIGKHYTLSTNYRSTTQLVDAINQMYSEADKQAEGAFRFKSENDNPLPYSKVKAKGRDDEWVINNHAAPPLTLWHWESDTAIGLPDYRQAMAEVTASEIVRLLNSGSQTQTGFKKKSGQINAIQPSDIAILVRTGLEAKVLRFALANRQLRSVYLSERDSIYQTNEAADILIWLKAITEPRNERKVRAALSTGTIGWDIERLHQLTQDESSWDQQLERFLGYHQRWLQDGILPSLRQLINDYGLHAQLNKSSEGERRLTNVLHLAELLQQASAQFEGQQALIRHLAEEIVATNPANNESVIRLESDADLIKIITIHKSKGLEYPLVFLPFVCGFREVSKQNSAYYRYHNSDQQLCIDLDLDDENRVISDKERHQEDIRLLYVALTRAKVACWLGIAPIKSGNTKSCQLEKSAIGYLLGWQSGMQASALTDQLVKLKGNCQTIDIQSLPTPSNDVYFPPKQNEKLGLPRSSTTKISDKWWIASYSALQTENKTVAQRSNLVDFREPETADDDKRSDEAEITFDSSTKAFMGIHSLPRGAGPGVLIHTLLEQSARIGFKTMLLSADSREQTINKLFSQSVWDDKHKILSTALEQWLTMPLFEDSDASLSHLATEQFQAEMEFLIGTDNVDVCALDQLVSLHLFPGKPRPALLPSQLHGLLKGFIDLVFIHKQKYYIADYKFNALGTNDAAYDKDALETTMLEKRYDLQSALYLLALHRLLKARLGNDYDYDSHVGGFLYWFLRGVNATSCGRVFDKPSRSFIDNLDSLFCGSSRKGDDS